MERIKESFTKKISDKSQENMIDDIEIIDHKEYFFDLCQKFGLVINEEGKGLFPSSMALRPIVWKDGWRDPHAVGDIYIDWDREYEGMKKHLKITKSQIDVSQSFSFEKDGKTEYIFEIMYEFDKIWFCIGYFTSRGNRRITHVTIENMPKTLLKSFVSYCQRYYSNGLKESFTKKISSKTSEDVLKKASFYSVGDFYPDFEHREGIVIFDGTDGVNPLTICGLKIQIQEKKLKGEVKKFKDFTFKEACKESHDSKRGKFQTYYTKLNDEWYVPCSDELEQMSKIIREDKFPLRIANHFWSSTKSPYHPSWMAQNIHLSVYDKELLCDTQCRDTKLDTKAKILLFKQIKS